MCCICFFVVTRSNVVIVGLLYECGYYVVVVVGVVFVVPVLAQVSLQHKCGIFLMGTL